MSLDAFESLRRTVQSNCHISDAHYAQGYSLCIYLLKMREFFRWEQGLSFADELPREVISDWLSERESCWDTLEGAEFEPLPVYGEQIAPFDGEAINARLLERGLVYSAGYGPGGKPLFFLGTLLRREQRDGLTILVSDSEHARDLAAPPAMLQGDTVFVRRESLRRTLWEMVEGWGWKRTDTLAGNALAPYDFAADPDAAIDAMTDTEIETVILHEIGEAHAGRVLGEAWHEMLADLGRSKAEFTARAVRDLIADCDTTLPALLARDDDRSLRLFMAAFTDLRKALFPELLAAYRDYRTHGDRSTLVAMVEAGHRRWTTTAERMLATWRTSPAEARSGLGEMLVGIAEAKATH